MRRTVIVLIISTVLLWGTAVSARRLPATRWDGDPDEYQATAIHDERGLKAWSRCRPNGSHFRTSQIASGARASKRPGARSLGKLLWEFLFLGKTQRCSGEGG